MGVPRTFRVAVVLCVFCHDIVVHAKRNIPGAAGAIEEAAGQGRQGRFWDEVGQRRRHVGDDRGAVHAVYRPVFRLAGGLHGPPQTVRHGGDGRDDRVRHAVVVC